MGRLAAALDHALYTDQWAVDGELPQLEDTELGAQDPDSDSDEECAPQD